MLSDTAPAGRQGDASARSGHRTSRCVPGAHFHPHDLHVFFTMVKPMGMIMV